MWGFFKYTFFILTLCFVVAPIHAQKRKVKNKKQGDNATRESEYYFTEAEKYYILEDYAKAMALFQKSIDTDPKNDAGYYKIAQIKLKDKEFTAALSHALKAKNLDPQNKYYYLLLIDLYTEIGEFEKVISTYDYLISEIKGGKSYLNELAELHTYLKNYDKAIETYNKLEDQHGVTIDIALKKHKLYLQSNNRDQALQELKELYHQFPFEEQIVIAYSEFLISLDQDQKAIDILSAYNELDAGNESRTSLLLGEVYRKNKQYKQALPYLQVAFGKNELPVNIKVQLIAQYRTLQKSEELNSMILNLCELLVTVHSDEPNAWSVFGDFYQEIEKPKKAAEQYHKSVKLDPTNFSVWQNLLLLKMQTEQYEDVIKISDHALEYFPNQAVLYYISGMAQIKSNQFDDAIYTLKTGKRLAGGNQKIINDFNSLLGEAYNGTGNYQKSDEAYQEVLKATPDNYFVMNNYSYFLAQRNDKLDLAEKISAKLVKNNPSNPNYLDTYAWVLYKSKKYKDAKKMMEKAIKLEGVSAVHFEHYGDILYKLNDIDGAVAQWQKARGLDSSLYMIDKKIADRKLYEK